MNMATLLRGWTFMRLLRLAMGVLFAIQAVQFHETLAGVVSVFFLFQAVTNTGCCGASGCVAPKGSVNNKGNEVVYEEIKIKE
jgi:hypothetical protein